MKHTFWVFKTTRIDCSSGRLKPHLSNFQNINKKLKGQLIDKVIDY